MTRATRIIAAAVLSTGLAFTGGCAKVVAIASERVAEDLRQAVLDHDDPETVRAGAPAWLLMTDAMAAGSPGNAGIQAQAALLYAAYANGFVTGDPERARKLTRRASGYGRRALCAQRGVGCGLLERPFMAFEADISDFTRRDIDVLYAAAVAELAYIQAHSDDWGALADLPRAETMLERVIALDSSYERGTPFAYLGVLNSLRPPALGGDPEDGRAHFERAIELSDGHDLMAKVLYAEHYARLTFDRALHDRLLEEVLAADPERPGFTFTNVLAQRRAAGLLAESGDYFFDE